MAMAMAFTALCRVSRSSRVQLERMACGYGHGLHRFVPSKPEQQRKTTLRLDKASKSYLGPTAGALR